MLGSNCLSSKRIRAVNALFKAFETCGLLRNNHRIKSPVRFSGEMFGGACWARTVYLLKRLLRLLTQEKHSRPAGY